MWTRTLLSGMSIALGMMACSTKPLPNPLDGSAEVQTPSDAFFKTDTMPSSPDSISPVPDAMAPDVAVPDVIVPVGPNLDGAVSDGLARDGAPPADAAVFDGRDLALSDTAGPDVAREAAADPFAGRTFGIDPTNPAPTPDPACTRSGPAAYADLTFSSDLGTVTGVAVEGSTARKFTAKLGPEANRMTFHISNLMGGLVYLEGDQGVWVAEVILFGSGVPVIWCLRGALTPQP